MVKTSLSNAGGVGSIPGQGAKIPHPSWPNNQNMKQKQYCNKFNKDFENTELRCTPGTFILKINKISEVVIICQLPVAEDVGIL